MTPNNILLFKKDQFISDIGILQAFANYHAIEKVKHGKERPEEVAI